MPTPQRPTRPAPPAETVATVSFGPIDASPADLSVLGYALAHTSGVQTVDIDFSQETITVAFDPSVASEAELDARIWAARRIRVPKQPRSAPETLSRCRRDVCDEIRQGSPR